MIDFIKYFKFELAWIVLFLAAVIVEGFDWLLFAGMLVCVCSILIRKLWYGKNIGS